MHPLSPPENRLTQRVHSSPQAQQLPAQQQTPKFAAGLWEMPLEGFQAVNPPRATQGALGVQRGTLPHLVEIFGEISIDSWNLGHSSKASGFEDRLGLNFLKCFCTRDSCSWPSSHPILSLLSEDWHPPTHGKWTGPRSSCPWDGLCSFAVAPGPLQRKELCLVKAVLFHQRYGEAVQETQQGPRS